MVKQRALLIMSLMLCLCGPRVMAQDAPCDKGKIAYLADEDLYITDLCEDTYTRLTVGEDIEQVAFSPDGSQIAFTVRLSSSASQIDVMDVDVTNRHTVSSGVSFANYPAWSPDSERITFTALEVNAPNLNTHIYAVNPDGSDLHVLVSPMGSAGIGAWSPDGTRLAVTSFESEDKQGIYIVTAANGEMAYDPVASGDKLDNYVVWSPASDQIAYTASSHLYLLDVSHLLNVQVMQEMPRVDSPRWSPDGQQMVVAASQTTLGRAGAATQIYTLSTQTWDAVQLTAGPNDYWPVWSPDGTQIAFMSVREGTRSAIYVMNADGSDQTRIAQPQATDNVLPVWSR